MAQAERLRAAPGGLELHRRTGTPVHPMAPLPKLVWFREEQPELFARVRGWAGIKEHVLRHLTAEWVTDLSVASATGLLDQAALDWDAEALELAGLGPERLPALVPSTHVLALVPAAATSSACPRTRRSWWAARTGRSPTSASARCARASGRAPSARAARCG
jgi:gluconokinase